MKTKLLFSFLVASAAVVAQEIPGFYTPLAPATHYDVVMSTTDINQTPAGPDLTWDFNSLVSIGTSVTETLPDISAEFPNTTAVVRTTSTLEGQDTVNDIYLALPSTGASITGVTFFDVVLSYSTNNGFIGQFPLSYGYNNEDPVAGTFTGMGATGTFTGTATVAVDAYGTFSANIGGIPANTPVTRLKITQSLTFTASPIPISLGTASQTIYLYYSSQSTTDPVFRSTTTTLNLPLAGIDETTSTYEIYSATMGTDKFSAAKVSIAPNPVADVLHFSGDAAVKGVTITDFSGRTVLRSASASDIQVSHLSVGIYNVAVQTEYGVSVQKMIKR
ncbi:T9SS type A sorting domain-containing protein [Flavobacterium sp. Sd200]|uniref:T9SS type A sorting domain-containing protein n=1 Tax=Flavobacterium sp. Sd200 TaxID=2692211 RepID=UPI00136F174C|nr:T9SS type A sorting domain-containing protein [Flavobacterium sp. Sd200]MXN92813.1 T9SS type A sorting domain-containing protein [Flavobacterium sp. Sd200]